VKGCIVSEAEVAASVVSPLIIHSTANLQHHRHHQIVLNSSIIELVSQYSSLKIRK